MTNPDDGLTRVPPQDLSAEQSVLGGMLLSPRAVQEVVEILEGPEFYRPAHETIYRTITSMAVRGEPTDPITVAAELTKRGELARVGGASYLHTLVENTPTAANAEYYAEIVHELAVKRDVLQVAERAVHTLRTGDGDLDAILATVRAEITAATEPGTLGGRTQRLDKYAVDGWEFITEAAQTRDPIWGTRECVIWPQGESLMICGKPGIGKTTLAQQLIPASFGVFSTVLNQPVAECERVLYLALDRPAQIGRALSRLFLPQHERMLKARLVVWRGPLPAALDKEPHLLAELADRHGAQRVFIDSLKDSVTKLTDDEAALAYNQARQNALREGIELLEPHHQRKRAGDDAEPKGKRPELDQVYGSTWYTSGAGSVLFLTGTQGDPEVKLWHLKQAVGELGPLDIVHDYAAGMSTVAQSGPAVSNEMVQAEATLFKVMQECFPDITATTKDLLEASGLVRPTYHRARRSLMSKGVVLNVGSDRMPRYRLSDTYAA
ncbi:DnaB-like helicase N-terminal domain-containing protein [Streptomyces sp. NPDC005355]|uniref:DnaB-like helicase N-terminal domain-containing protein n=1 Tax=Streptomyces sp. NPDC005355 TaxID=3157038 RepID=UPI0033B7682D